MQDTSYCVIPIKIGIQAHLKYPLRLEDSPPFLTGTVHLVDIVHRRASHSIAQGPVVGSHPNNSLL